MSSQPFSRWSGIPAMRVFFGRPLYSLICRDWLADWLAAWRTARLGSLHAGPTCSPFENFRHSQRLDFSLGLPPLTARTLIFTNVSLSTPASLATVFSLPFSFSLHRCLLIFYTALLVLILGFDRVFLCSCFSAATVPLLPFLIPSSFRYASFLLH